MRIVYWVVMTGLSVVFASCGGSVSTPFSGPEGTPIVDSGGSSWGDGTPPATHNTSYCAVDSSGHVTSSDSNQVQDGDIITGIGGGCISRPIREVWAVVLNHQLIKASDVDEYHPTARPDLLDPSHGTYFVFDIESIVHALGGVVTVDWVTRWYHTVSHGTYAAPNQIAINLQKIQGTTHISYDKEGYVLDRVTSAVTSFVMKQSLKADQVDVNRVHRNISDIIGKLRTGAAAWSEMPDHPPGMFDEGE